MPRTIASHVRNTAPPAGFMPVDGWRARAFCRNHPMLPPSTWDDSLVTDGDVNETQQQRGARMGLAKAACGHCPVQAACLAAVDLAYDEGVRGGIDLRELRAARRTAAAVTAVAG